MWRPSPRSSVLSLTLLLLAGCPSMWHKDHGVIHEAMKKDLNAKDSNDIDERVEKLKCPEGKKKYVDCGAPPCKVECR